MARGLQIGEVAKITGLSIDTIRFYQKEHLLNPPERSPGGFRVFHEDDIRRITFIRNAQQLGFTLQQIRELLVVVHEKNIPPCPHVRDILVQKRAQVHDKMRELVNLESTVTAALDKCNRALEQRPMSHEGPCPVLEQLASMQKQPEDLSE